MHPGCSRDVLTRIGPRSSRIPKDRFSRRGLPRAARAHVFKGLKNNNASTFNHRPLATPTTPRPRPGELDSDSDCAIVESLAEVAVPNAGGLAGCGSPEPAHSIRSLGPGTTEPGTSSCHPQDVLVEEESMIESEEEATCSECCSMLSEQQCLGHSPLLSHLQVPAPGSASSKQEATQLPAQARPGPQFTMITSHIPSLLFGV